MASTLKASPVPEKSPLSGLRVLVGRARAQASALSSGLRALGAEVVEIPFIEVRRPRSYQPLDAALKNLIRYDWLVLTSVNGVEAVAERLKTRELDGEKSAALPLVAAIGPATQQAIERLGIPVHVVPERYVAESVVDSLREQVKGKRVLLARAKVARDVIPRELRRLGAQVEVVGAYRLGFLWHPAPAWVCSQGLEALPGRDHLHQFFDREKLPGVAGASRPPPSELARWHSSGFDWPGDQQYPAGMRPCGRYRGLRVHSPGLIAAIVAATHR